MSRKQVLLAVFALIAGAAVLFTISRWRNEGRRGRPAFVQTDGARFVIDSKPFRFVGANVAVMYRDEDRARMPETLQQAAMGDVFREILDREAHFHPPDIGLGQNKLVEGNILRPAEDKFRL